MKRAGIYENVHINEYHSDEGISSSGIKLILDCPRRYWEEYMNPNKPEKEPTRECLIGKAVHALLLEPEKFEKDYYPMTTPVDLRTKLGKEIFESAEFEAQGRTIIRADVWAEIIAIVESAQSNSLWNEVFHMGDRMTEISLYWDMAIENVRLKARPDLYNKEFVIDVKTCRSIPEFRNSIFSSGYHRQAAMQLDGLKALGEGMKQHGFFVVETKYPYLTAFFSLDGESVQKGREEYKDGATVYGDCLRYGMWPGYEQKFQLVKLPSWIKAREDIF